MMDYARIARVTADLAAIRGVDARWRYWDRTYGGDERQVVALALEAWVGPPSWEVPHASLR
jgi:hypothetical protein